MITTLSTAPITNLNSAEWSNQCHRCLPLSRRRHHAIFRFVLAPTQIFKVRHLSFSCSILNPALVGSIRVGSTLCVALVLIFVLFGLALFFTPPMLIANLLFSSPFWCWSWCPTLHSDPTVTVSCLMSNACFPFACEMLGCLSALAGLSMSFVGSCYWVVVIVWWKAPAWLSVLGGCQSIAIRRCVN